MTPRVLIGIGRHAMQDTQLGPGCKRSRPSSPDNEGFPSRPLVSWSRLTTDLANDFANDCATDCASGVPCNPLPNTLVVVMPRAQWQMSAT